MAWLCPDQSFLSLCRRRRVPGLSMLYKVNSNSNHCLFTEIPSASTRVRHTRIHFSLKYQCVERPNLQGLSCWLMFECRMTFPTQWLTPERFKRAVNIPELSSSVFVAQVLVGLRDQFIKNFLFLTLVCTAGFNNNNIYKGTHIVSFFTVRRQNMYQSRIYRLQTAVALCLLQIVA